MGWGGGGGALTDLKNTVNGRSGRFWIFKGTSRKMFVLHDKALETRYRKEPYVEQTRVLFADILFSLLPHYKRSLNESEREAIFMEKLHCLEQGLF